MDLKVGLIRLGLGDFWGTFGSFGKTIEMNFENVKLKCEGL